MFSIGSKCSSGSPTHNKLLELDQATNSCMADIWLILKHPQLWLGKLKENGIRLEDIDSVRYIMCVLRGTYLLCRCGASKNKPFCDGTHRQISFEGSETASRKSYLEKAEIFEGPDLKLTDAHEFCDHSRFCLRSGGIRNLIQKSDDPEARQTAIEEAIICPSGRLVLWDKKTGRPFEKGFDPSIVLVLDKQKGCEGPLWVRGGVPIESADGSMYESRNRVTLCRCGKSENKPYCDGSHWMNSQQKLEFTKKWGLGGI